MRKNNRQMVTLYQLRYAQSHIWKKTRKRNEKKQSSAKMRCQSSVEESNFSQRFDAFMGSDNPHGRFQLVDIN